MPIPKPILSTTSSASSSRVPVKSVSQPRRMMSLSHDIMTPSLLSLVTRASFLYSSLVFKNVCWSSAGSRTSEVRGEERCSAAPDTEAASDGSFCETDGSSCKTDDSSCKSGWRCSSPDTEGLSPTTKSGTKSTDSASLTNSMLLETFRNRSSARTPASTISLYILHRLKPRAIKMQPGVLLLASVNDQPAPCSKSTRTISSTTAFSSSEQSAGTFWHMRWRGVVVVVGSSAISCEKQ